MQWLSVFAFCITAIFLYSFLRQYNPTYSFLLSLSVCAGIIILALSFAQPLLSFVNNLSQFTGIGDFSIIYKTVGISVLASFAQDLCKESNNEALAGRIELIGKIMMLTTAIPLFSTLTDIILELLR